MMFVTNDKDYYTLFFLYTYKIQSRPTADEVGNVEYFLYALKLPFRMKAKQNRQLLEKIIA